MSLSNDISFLIITSIRIVLNILGRSKHARIIRCPSNPCGSGLIDVQPVKHYLYSASRKITHATGIVCVLEYRTRRPWTGVISSLQSSNISKIWFGELAITGTGPVKPEFRNRESNSGSWLIRLTHVHFPWKAANSTSIACMNRWRSWNAEWSPRM